MRWSWLRMVIISIERRLACLLAARVLRRVFRLYVDPPKKNLSECVQQQLLLFSGGRRKEWK